MLVDIDSKNNNDFIIEELDEEHILVMETKINELKSRLNQVWIPSRTRDIQANIFIDDERSTQGAREFRYRINVIEPISSPSY